MSIRWKLFASYLVVIAVGAIILIVTTLSIAPMSFEQHMGNMRGMANQNSSMSGRMMNDLEADVNESFNRAMTNALIFATIAATSAAGIVSAYVSYRITSPIRATVQASQRIASGQYDERLIRETSDELGQLTQSFNQMATALEEIETTREEIETTRQRLVADISHELKTPLASIQGYMEGLEDGVIAPTNETFQQVHRETKRLQRLVHDLQELSRVEGGQMTLQLSSHDIIALIQSTCDWIRPQFVDKQVQLVLDLPEKTIEVDVDYDRLRQVLLNLLGNALQYTPTGGSVTIHCEFSALAVLIQIQDTGAGLSEQDKERIFERFYRVDKSRSRLSGGSGIGLTIARHIIQAHRGELWADSAGINQGSTFFIRLPRHTNI